MVERKTTRTHKIDGKDYIAIKREEWTNGKGKTVVQVMEEHNITPQEIDDVINVHSEEENNKVQEEKKKLKKEMKEMKESIKDIVHSREYLKFKKMLEDKDVKQFFDTMKKEKTLVSAESRLNELDRIEKDIVEWKKQFERLKEDTFKL